MARKQKLKVVKAKDPPNAPVTAADALRRLIARALASKWRKEAASSQDADGGVRTVRRSSTPSQSDDGCKPS